MKYIVEVVETSRASVEIEADNVDEAEALAWEQQSKGNLAFVTEDIYIESIKEDI